MSLPMLVYSPLKEDDTKEGWDKSTIEYVRNNEKKVRKMISAVANRNNFKVQKIEADDILSELYSYFHSIEDYDIGRASENIENGGSAMSFESFVQKAVDNCTKRYISSRGKNDKQLVPNTYMDGDEQVDIWERIADPKAEADVSEILESDLDMLCSQNEWQRYQLGCDIFKVFYITVLTNSLGRNDILKDILETIGETKQTPGECDIPPLGQEIARQISSIGQDRAMDILENYVFSAEKVNMAVHVYVDTVPKQENHKLERGGSHKPQNNDLGLG